MARLPTPGGDDGTWGGVLNDFLNQAHNSDGTLKSSAVTSAGAEVTTNKGAAGGYAPLDGTGKVPAANLPVSGGTPDADATTKGVVQLAGDLSGTAASPQIATGVIVNTDINASANIAQSKIANLTSDLAGKASSSHIHAQADVTNLTTDLAAKANDADVVHDTGDETIAGIKTFSSSPVVPDSSFAQSKVTNLTTDLASKVGTSSTDTLTNKTITDSSNNVTANSLRTTTTSVSVSGAAAPTSGQFLRASNGTTAAWQAMPRMFGWFLEGVLVVGDGQGPIYRIDADVTILGLDMSAKIAPLTTDATFDVETSSSPTGVFTSIFSVLPTIPASQNVGTSGTLSTTTINAGLYVRFNVDAVGGTAAQGVTAQIRMETR